jgi:hypothetical protein
VRAGATCTSVVRQWTANAGLDDATAFVHEDGSPHRPIESLGWAASLELYRPFLSYAELGALVDGKPSEMYDALQAILGLDQLIDAERRLKAVRKHLDESSTAARQALPALLEGLRGHPDERARRAEAALSGRRWDLATVEILAVGDEVVDDGLAGRLHLVASLTLPDAETIDTAVQRLVAAEERVAGLAGTPAEAARHLAGLLGAALSHYDDHPGEPCPVCAGRTLDEAWADSARDEVARLTEIALDADAALRSRDSAARDLRGLIPTQPAVLSSDLGEVDASAVRAAWQQWVKLVTEGDAQQLTADAGEKAARLGSAVDEIRTAAGHALQRRSEAWQPTATALAAWAGQARAGERAAADLGRVKQAVEWLKTAGQEVRDARLAPFATLSAEVWETLRQESNVELGPIRLEGSASRRRVSLDVTIDGVPGAALGVMSQGELHALGLALFLPRATAAESPFRFLLIDDPVQAMDPAKVEGLARVLSGIAASRQVIVFTHDDRLPEAVRRLQLPATVWEVVRREGSVIELKKSDDPVSRYLDDARALVSTSDLPEEARAVVVAGFCRSALEAACHEVIRARRLAAGVPHAEVERALIQAQTLHQAMALALFDNVARGSQVVPELRSTYGENAVNAFVTAKAGTHTAYRGDLAKLVRDVARLARRLRP